MPRAVPGRAVGVTERPDLGIALPQPLCGEGRLPPSATVADDASAVAARITGLVEDAVAWKFSAGKCSRAPLGTLCYQATVAIAG